LSPHRCGNVSDADYAFADDGRGRRPALWNVIGSADKSRYTLMTT
jgi:hypothetical protein